MKTATISHALVALFSLLLSGVARAEDGLFVLRYQDPLGTCVSVSPPGVMGTPMYLNDSDVGPHCGRSSVGELLADSKFLFRADRIEEGKFTIRTLAGGEACLVSSHPIRQPSGDAFTLTLKPTPNGALCGHPNRAALLQDKSLLFGIEPIGGGPTVIKTLLEDGLTCLGRYDTMVVQRNFTPSLPLARNAFCGLPSQAALAAQPEVRLTFERVNVPVPPSPPAEIGYQPPTGQTWDALSKAYFAALNGSAQGLCVASTVGSPVPIATADAIRTNLPALDFSGYTVNAPAVEKLVSLNNGHAYEIVADPDEYRFVLGEDNLFNRQPDFFKTYGLDPPLPRVLTIGGVPYTLLQLHFHSPSEHLIDGRRYAMEAHLVHRSEQGHLAVVAVLVDRIDRRPVSTWFNGFQGVGPQPGALQTRFTSLPGLLPPADSGGQRAYVRYDGSLTTPPCTEAVSWIVLTTPVPIYLPELSWFTTLFPVNARPLQQLNGRLVLTPQ